MLYLFDVSNVPGLSSTNINTLFNNYSGNYSKSFLKPSKSILSTLAITTTGNYTVIAPGVTTLPSGPGPSWTGYPPNLLDISKIDTSSFFKNENTNPAIANISNGIPINTTVTIDISEVIADYVSVMKSENLYVLGIALQNNTLVGGVREYYSFYYIPYNFTSATLSESTFPVSSNAFITKWTVTADPNITKEGRSIYLPLIDITRLKLKYPYYNTFYNFTVNWGDGTSNTVTDSNYSSDKVSKHTYAVVGTYIVTITGTIRGWSFGWGLYPGPSPYNSASADSITDVTQWGCLKLLNYDIYNNETTRRYGFFYYCPNLTQISATDTPALGEVSDFFNCFQDCQKLTTITKISNWDVSNITNMSSMFRRTYSFNQDILWGSKTGNVTNMTQMFDTSSLFNGNITGWDVSKVQSMSEMFHNAIYFNQNISVWNVKSLISLKQMFYHEISLTYPDSFFNQDLSSWGTKLTALKAQIAAGTANPDAQCMIFIGCTRLNTTNYNTIKTACTTAGAAINFNKATCSG